MKALFVMEVPYMGVGWLAMICGGEHFSTLRKPIYALVTQGPENRISSDCTLGNERLEAKKSHGALIYRWFSPSIGWILRFQPFIFRRKSLLTANFWKETQLDNRYFSKKPHDLGSSWATRPPENKNMLCLGNPSYPTITFHWHPLGRSKSMTRKNTHQLYIHSQRHTFPLPKVSWVALAGNRHSYHSYHSHHPSTCIRKANLPPKEHAPWTAICLSSWWLNQPILKYARQIGSFPQFDRVKTKNTVFETTT